MLHHALFLLGAPDYDWQLAHNIPRQMICAQQETVGQQWAAIPLPGSGLYMRNSRGEREVPLKRGWMTYKIDAANDGPNSEPIGPLILDPQFGTVPPEDERQSWAPHGHVPGFDYRPEEGGDDVRYRMWVIRGRSTGQWARFKGLRFWFV